MVVVVVEFYKNVLVFLLGECVGIPFLDVLITVCYAINNQGDGAAVEALADSINCF